MIWWIFAVLPEIIWSSKSWFALLGKASIILEQLDPRALCQQNSCSKLVKEVLCTGKSEWKLLQLLRPCSAVPGDYRARLNEINIGMILPFYAQTILQLKSKQRFPHAYAKFSVHAMLSWLRECSVNTAPLQQHVRSLLYSHCLQLSGEVNAEPWPDASMKDRDTN